ncbi:MAG: response regulator transcription factor [Opitutaceae bacterium]|nr:response regulator transcription factor [Opitutaceae bacterium]
MGALTHISATASWRELAAELAPAPFETGRLSPAEEVVCVHLRQGLSNREIAFALGKSERTVKNQVSACLAKYGVPTRARLIALLR